MPIFIVTLLIQIALVVHIIKTGRQTVWIWVVVLLPMAGSIAYLIIELLPDLAGTRTGRKTQKKIQTIVNPHRDINEASRHYAMSDSVENSRRLAEELLNKELFEEARDLYKRCLKGVHEHDPYIMHGLAKAEFGLNNFSKTKTVLDNLILYNPDFKNSDAHLLYARTAEQLHDIESALHEYATLDQYYPGPEASYHYAHLLAAQGEQQKAQEIFAAIIAKAKLSGSHYRDIHKKWIKLAASEYRA